MSDRDPYDLPFIPRVDYPESDGKPMAETEIHGRQIMDLFAALDAFFASRADVQIGADQLHYYVEGDPTKRVAPDVYVVLGVPKHVRRTYKLWDEGRAPDVIFEVTSKGTKDEDLGTKKGLYEYLGVHEYFLVDPLGEYLDPPVQGMRLGPGGYLRMAGEIYSERLGLSLRWTGDSARLIERASGRMLPTPLENHARAQRAEARADSAEAELARLRAEIERLRR